MTDVDWCRRLNQQIKSNSFTNDDRDDNTPPSRCNKPASTYISIIIIIIIIIIFAHASTKPQAKN